MTTISNLNFDEAVEPQPLPRAKYQVQVTAAEEKVTGPNSKRPGSPQIRVTLGFTGPSKEEQNAPPINHFISLPHEDDEAGAANFKVLLLKRFLTLFNVPFSNGDLDVEALCFDLIGRSANAEVTLGEPDDNGNVYNSLVVPRIPNEPTSGRGRRG